MSLRAVHTDVQGSLLKGDSFVYAHLLKFERVIKTQSAKPPETATDYSYVTDASVDITWDDGSKDVSDTSNGAQTYVANRLLKVGGINETTEAKASNLAVTVSSVALGATMVASSTNRISLTRVNTSTYPYTGALTLLDTNNDDWLESGFSEGDKITITHPTSDWNGLEATIDSFTGQNEQIPNIQANITFVGKTQPAAYQVNQTNVTIDLATDEVVAILNDPNNTTYAGYINREVFIYKAHINTDTGAIIGAPYLIFKGIIAKAKLSEDVTKDSKVTWNLTSHWGDFVRVNGRRTSDGDHRAISNSGTPDPSSLHRFEYAGDMGFMHSEQAVNIIAIYQVMETRYKMKSSGFLGLKKKMKEYQVEVDRDVDLRINLEAKYLPVVYGVNRVDSIPVFADSLKSDSAKIYCVYAICEGEVSGIYDIYVDDQSRICVDKNDSDTRSTQTSEKTIDVICEGRMDRGDTLSSSAASNRAAGYNYGLPMLGGFGTLFGNMLYYHQGRNYGRNTAPVTNSNSDAGVTHEKQTKLEYPIKTTLQFHAGRPYQRSNDMLTGIAAAGTGNGTGGFKLQGDIADDKDNYWNANHRLLDTAYVAAEFEIAEGDVTIPQLDFVVRGKEIEQYNYDYSYNVAPNVVPATAATLRSTYFKVGDKVDFYKGNGDALAQDVQIAALTKYINSREEEVWKYRFVSNPLVNNSNVTSFKMVVNGEAHDHASAYWMVTWDHKALSSNTLTKTLTQLVTTDATDNNATMTNNGTTGGVDITNLNADMQKWIDYLKAQGGLTISVMGASFTISAEDLLENLASFTIDSEGTNPTAVPDGSDTKVQLPTGDAEQATILITNGIYIGDASGVKTSTDTTHDDYYKGQRIKVTQTLEGGDIKSQTREIIGYDASEQIAYVGSFGPIEQSAAAVGNFTVQETANWPSYTVKLTSVSGLAVGNIIEVVTPAAGGAVSWVTAGAKITQINSTTKVITIDQPGSFVKDSVISSAVSTNSSGTVATGHPFEFMPLGTDQDATANTKWEILPPGDTKVSINPAAQLLDYLTNKRYGKGLDLNKDIDLPSFQETMRACDTRSDVTLILPAGTYNAGDKYSLTTVVEVDGSNQNFFQWQGTVKEKEACTGYTVNNLEAVTFTDCIGKIAHKWHDWKSFDRGNIIYHKVGEVNRIYRVDTTGVISTAPSSGYASSLTLTKEGGGTVDVWLGADVAGNGGSTAAESSWDHNPVVKGWNATEKNLSPSGYSLYDSDDVKYWRYLGWQEHKQDEVTRHQTNAVIRTETPLFDNVNSMLEHFNGILRYSNGKYELGLKTAADTIPATITYDSVAYTDPRRVHADDIIGTITVDDAGLKGSANTVSVGISDPAIRYDKRSVSFYNSDYLKEDRGIPKKKTVKTPLITNYFNARMNAEQYLIDSRYARKISFQLGPQGVLLLAGEIILITYPRFNWTDKPFRISNLQVREDCLVQVTAEEHDDSVYKIAGKQKQLGPSGGGRSAGGTGRAEPPKPDNPTNLAATGTNNAINLTWDNAGTFGLKVKDSKNVEIIWNTVIYRHTSNSFTDATPITSFAPMTASEAITEYKDPFPDITSDTTYYYWIKHIRNGVSSLVHPTAANGVDAGNGVSATALAAAGSSGILYLYKSSIAEPTDDPSDDNLFPTVTVTLSGANAGKITGVATGQSSAALTNKQIIDTAGNGTGWYIEPVDATNADHVVWVVAATGNSSGATDEIARAEWTEPVKWSGGQGLNTAMVELYQLTNSDSAPADPTGALVYTFATGALATNNINNWSQTAASPVANNQYLWKITAAAINREDTHSIPAADWATAVLAAQYVEGATGSNAKAVKLTANRYAIPFTKEGTENTTLTFTAAPQGLAQGATATYKFEVDSGSGFAEKQAASTDVDYTMAQNDEPTSGDAHVVKVTFFEDGTAVATDSVSVYGVQDGSDALTIVVTNEAHVLTAANDGTISSYSGSGTDIRIYRGATLLTAATSGTTANTFTAQAAGVSITQSSVVGTVVSGALTGETNETLRYADHSNMTADTASVTYTIRAYDADGVVSIYKKVQSFSKSKTGAAGADGTGDDGEDGEDAKRTVHGYLYYEKTSSGAPSAPGEATYTFSTGDINGGTGATEVLGLSDTSAVNKWTNEPRPQDPTSSNTHWTVRYFGTEAAANSSTLEVTYSNIVQYTNFTGVVTFSDGTGGGDDAFYAGTTKVTTIDGGTIKTGSIGATQLAISNNASGSAGIYMDATNNAPKIVIHDGTAERVILGKL